MITLESRPKLASTVRLRHDPQSGKHMLLYPEKGLVLNGTGTEIARLCSGEHTVAEMVSTLRAQFGASAPASGEDEVLAFLAQLQQRGLLEV